MITIVRSLLEKLQELRAPPGSFLLSLGPRCGGWRRFFASPDTGILQELVFAPAPSAPAHAGALRVRTLRVARRRLLPGKFKESCAWGGMRRAPPPPRRRMRRRSSLQSLVQQQVSSWRHISCHTDKNRYYT